MPDAHPPRTAADDAIDQAVDIYHDTYRKFFPRGGDESDHDGAIQAAIEAVYVFLVEGRDPR